MPDTQLISFLNENWSIFVLIALWSLPWKGFALWYAAKRGQMWWFILMLLVNSVGILEIVYLFFVVKIGQKKKTNLE